MRDRGQAARSVPNTNLVSAPQRQGTAVTAPGPAVSVIIPAYNRAATVAQAIRSVIAQTYQDFEILVVDDCSTDDTHGAVAAVKDPRVRYLRHDRNRGGSAARNTGIAASTGRYIAFLDSDDEWRPEKLAKQVERFEASPPRVGLVGTGQISVYDNGRTWERPLTISGDVRQTLLTYNVVGSASNGMIRRSVIDVVTGFDETLPSWQDIDLWLRIAEHFDIAIVPEYLTVIHEHGSGNRITMNVASQIRGRELFCQKHAEAIRRGRVEHIHLRETGRMYQSGLIGDRAKARRWYLASIKAKPGSLVAYFLLASTYVPPSIYRTLLSFRRRVVYALADFRKTPS